MARSIDSDPLDKFRWKIEIHGFSGRVGFYSVEAPSVSISTRDYAEGGNHTNPKQIVDRITYKPIVLSRGVSYDRGLVNWIALALRYATDKYKDPDSGTFTKLLTDGLDNHRKDVTITHFNRVGAAVLQYKLFNCLPVEYQAASDFAADADDGVSMERLVLKYEGFTAIPSPLADKAISAIENL